MPVSLKEYARGLARKAVNKFPMQPKVYAQIRDLEAELRSLQTTREQVKNVQVMCEQLQDVIKEMGGEIPPPQHLQERVIGGYVPGFIRSGAFVVDDLNAVLAYDNKSIRSFEKILDFGCGCGRILRALRRAAAPSQMLYGTDIDAEAIQWCQVNYPRIAEFGVNPTMPPMSYADEQFDLIYSISIFTHLPEDMQFDWLAELRRITRPGGYLILSVSGKSHYKNIPQQFRGDMEEKGFFYTDVGHTDGLPEFYRTSFHAPDYIRSRWSDYFDILDIKETAISESQDAVLCRKRTGS